MTLEQVIAHAVLYLFKITVLVGIVYFFWLLPEALLPVASFAAVVFLLAWACHVVKEAP